jgi:hypothetical protein
MRGPGFSAPALWSDRTKLMADALGKVGSLAAGMPEEPERMRQMLRFFAPVVATGVLMAFSYTAVMAGLNRTLQPAVAVAAYALAFNLAVVIEAPIVMLRQTVLVLVNTPEDLRLLSRLAAAMALALCGLQALLAIGPWGMYVLGHWLGIPSALLGPTQVALAGLLPLQILSAIRYVCHGLLLRAKQTHFISLGMGARVLTTTLVIPVLLHWPGLGSLLASTALVLGMVVETVIDVWRARVAGGTHQTSVGDAVPLTTVGVVSFLGPLAAMGVVECLAAPVRNAGLARATQPELVLAAFSLTWTIVSMVIPPLQNLHQVAVVFGTESRAWASIRRFFFWVAVVATAIAALLGWSPLGQWILEAVLGASAEIVDAATQNLRWLTPLPALLVVGDFIIGKMLIARRTTVLVAGKLANLGVTALAAVGVGMLARRWGPGVGAVIVLSGAVAEAVVLGLGQMIVASGR